MGKPSRFAEIDAELSAVGACKLCVFLDAAAPEDAEFIGGLLGDPAKGPAHITRVLTAGGVEITESSVKRHRQKHQGK